MKPSILRYLVTAILLAAPATAQTAAGLDDEEFSFNPLKVKRDPFTPPPVQPTEDVSDLLNFDLFELKLVAVMTGLGAPKAMVVLPDGKTHIVQQNDRIGRNRGFVVQVKENELVVQETFRDHRNREKKEFRTLKIEK
jgi:Tfp pilus assembly protein PilP